MDWLDLATQILAGLILLAISWGAATLRSLKASTTRALSDLRDSTDRNLEEFKASTDARLDKIEQRIVRVEDIKRHDVIGRLSKVERQVAAGTSQDQLRRIHARIDEEGKSHAELSSAVAAVAGQVKTIYGTMQLIQKHLMEKGGAA